MGALAVLWQRKQFADMISFNSTLSLILVVSHVDLG
jgi:hypothetical protein